MKAEEAVMASDVEANASGGAPPTLSARAPAGRVSPFAGQAADAAVPPAVTQKKTTLKIKFGRSVVVPAATPPPAGTVGDRADLKGPAGRPPGDAPRPGSTLPAASETGRKSEPSLAPGAPRGPTSQVRVALPQGERPATSQETRAGWTDDRAREKEQRKLMKSLRKVLTERQATPQAQSRGGTNGTNGSGERGSDGDTPAEGAPAQPATHPGAAAPASGRPEARNPEPPAAVGAVVEEGEEERRHRRMERKRTREVRAADGAPVVVLIVVVLL